MTAFLCLRCFFVFPVEGACPQCEGTQSEEFELDDVEAEDEIENG